MKKAIFTLVILLLGFNGLLAQFSAGTGTSSDPWQISNTTDLSFLSANSGYWGDYFIQTADIDAPFGSFSPIGNSTTNFTGSYDGDGHTIDRLFISGSNSECGLFGFTYTSSNIIDLGIINVNISGFSVVGGLVGRNFGTLSKCYSIGSVTGASNYVGGLVGINFYGTITECYSTCSVKGVDYNIIGGLAGGIHGGTITKCYSTGSVEGYTYVGGLVGINRYSTVTECYSTGSVKGNSVVGGLVGINYYSSTVTECYSTGSVTGNTYTGGLVGWNGYLVNNSFWDTETSGQLTSDGGTGKTTAYMQTQSTFTSAGWDFIDIWVMDGYPVFKGDCPPVLVNAGSDTTIFYGFGDESATLTAIADGGTGQYSYLWSNNATTQTITVNPTTTTTYTVTVTDECNNTVSDEVTVNVIDVRCGKNNNKVLVCHKGKTICISPNAVQTHLNNHGDYLGSCGDQLVTLPTEYELHANYPNPFNPTTRIDYSLPFDSKVSLQIFDILGREMITLVDENQRAGYYTIDFNASNLASGIYYYRMVAGDFTAIKKMVVIK